MTPRELVALLGGHPSAELALRGHSINSSEPDQAIALSVFSNQALDRWLVACCLLGRNIDLQQGCASIRTLEAAGLALPSAVAGADPLSVESLLVSANHPKAEQDAHLLVRVCRALQERYGGSLAAVASGADDLEDLAGRLLALAPGFGRAAVTRLLRPLRETWPQVDEMPLSQPAQAAAVHLAWISQGQDQEGPPGALRAFLRSEANETTPLCDIEAALERLGRKACLRERSDRCPLASRCPQRRVAEASLET